MREIKFRAKIKGDAGVYQVWAIDWLWQTALISRACGDERVPFEKIEAFQEYTGLKDKNDKEIYEGDICQYPGTIHRGEIVQVIWMENPASFSPMYSDGLTIIGNIYENPELLEKEKQL